MCNRRDHFTAPERQDRVTAQVGIFIDVTDESPRTIIARPGAPGKSSPPHCSAVATVGAFPRISEARCLPPPNSSAEPKKSAGKRRTFSVSHMYFGRRMLESVPIYAYNKRGGSYCWSPTFLGVPVWRHAFAAGLFMVRRTQDSEVLASSTHDNDVDANEVSAPLQPRIAGGRTR